mgnify:CR=1 FL=1
MARGSTRCSRGWIKSWIKRGHFFDLDKDSKDKEVTPIIPKGRVISAGAFLSRGFQAPVNIRVRELFDAHFPVGKLRLDLQFPAHGLDDVAQRRNVHVRTAFELGHRGLFHVQFFRQLLLAQHTDVP